MTSGTLTFAVPLDAPAQLFYQCSVHAAMSGTITTLAPAPVPSSARGWPCLLLMAALLATGCFAAGRRAALIAAALLLLVGRAPAVSPDLVVSQVYGGGGNSGATLRNDFIELFNRGSSAVNLAGWSVQYGPSSASSWQVTLLAGVIQPGQHLLVQEAQGAGGTSNLPTPDVTGTIAMSATAGIVALSNTTSAFPAGCPSGVPSLIDLVGYGSTSCAESGPTPTLSATTAALRLASGCTDTDTNPVASTSQRRRHATAAPRP